MPSSLNASRFEVPSTLHGMLTAVANQHGVTAQDLARAALQAFLTREARTPMSKVAPFRDDLDQWCGASVWAKRAVEAAFEWEREELVRVTPSPTGRGC